MAAPMAQMADIGIRAIMGIGNGVLLDAQEAAFNKVGEANAYANNLVRSANNALGAARASQARRTQSVNNNRVLENAGSDAESAQVNYRRQRDNSTASSFEDQIAAAEQAGRQAAQGAFSGLSGGVVDIVNGTTALRQSRLTQRAEEARRQGDYDASLMQKHIMQAGWDSLDSSEISPDIDYNQDVAVTRNRGGSLLSDALQGQDMKSLVNVGAYGAAQFKSFFKSGAKSEQV